MIKWKKQKKVGSVRIVDKIRKFAYALRNVGLESEGEPMQTSEIVAQFAEFADGTCKRERLAIAEYLLELTNIQDNS